MIATNTLLRSAGLAAAAFAFAACPLEKSAKGADAAKPGAPSAGAPGAPPAQPPVPVSAADAVLKDLPVQIRVVGQVEAVSTVMIKCEVTAPLLKAHFNEGDEVKKGDLLFTLDSRQFDLELASAKALAQKHEAELKNAKADAERFARLIEKKVVSQEEYDKARTNENSLSASLAADKAQVDLAQLGVDRCAIRAPIGGRAGSLTVHPGNLVKANDTEPLVTIHQIEPIHASFAVPEINLADLRRQQAEGKLKVQVVIPGQESEPVSGELDFIDSSVDAATGTIRLKALFPNKDRRLWPGQFIKVILTLSVQEGAIIVPSQAVQPSQKGPVIFVIGEGNAVQIRPAKTGMTVGSETVITEGVKPGEHVVTDGHLRLFPGAKVEIKQDPNTGEAK